MSTREFLWLSGWWLLAFQLFYFFQISKCILFLFKNFIGVQLIYSVVLVSGIQQSKSVIHILPLAFYFLCPLFLLLFVCCFSNIIPATPFPSADVSAQLSLARALTVGRPPCVRASLCQGPHCQPDNQGSNFTAPPYHPLYQTTPGTIDHRLGYPGHIWKQTLVFKRFVRSALEVNSHGRHAEGEEMGTGTEVSWDAAQDTFLWSHRELWNHSGFSELSSIA